MRKALIVLIAVLACSTLMVAQDKAEVFGGYSYVRANVLGTGINMNGWDAQVTGYVTKNFGITADINGVYKSENGASLKDHAFLFGPTLRMQNGPVTPYVHALFGVSHLTGSIEGLGSDSDNAFATALGGGIDVKAGKNLAIRVAQLDYLMTRHGSENQNNFRYSAGIVFKF